jgi:dTDP-4-dehydrorhamnose 3,5-epimerase
MQLTGAYGYWQVTNTRQRKTRSSFLKIEPFELAGLFLMTPRRFGDARGFFAETWSRRVLAEAGITTDFVQDNHSLSVKPGTVRGLHFQSPPHAQAKLVRCGRGRLFDVTVDLRRGSPTYGKWAGVELSAENGVQLYIPAGFGHGFVTREPDTEIVYKCSDYYAPECDGGIRWNDPDIAVDWGVSEAAGISDKDAKAQLLADFDSPFIWENVA